MKKHFVKRFLTLILTLFTFLLLVGCGNGKEIQFKLVDGADAPTEVNVEIGDLLSVPSLIAKNKKETFEVNVVVKDKNGNEVQINNNKVRATSMDGYTIEYTSGDKTYTITVKVIDTKAPKITVSAPDGMAVLLNQTVLIPVCTVSDASSSAIDASISVKDEDGNAVTVTDNTFVASKIGKYIISYEAVDASGNKGIKNLTVSCEKADLLNAFENEADVTYYAFNGTKEAVSENAFTGNAIKLTIDDDSNNTYRSINFPLKKDGEYISYEDLLVYEKVQLYVYITADNEIGLAHQTYPVTQGVNIIVFTREQIEAAYAFASSQYSENANGFLLNLRYQTNGMSLYLDNFIGIYPRDYEEPEPDKLSFEVESCDNLTVQLNELTKVPGCSVLDLDGNSVSYTVKVFKGNTEIELNDGAFTPAELGEYKVKYIVDSGELKGEKEITLISKKSVVLNDFISLTDITAATFEHEDFVLEDSVAFNKGIKIVAKNSEPSPWPQVYIPFKFNPTDEGFLSYDELKKFEKIQIVFKAKNAGTASLSNGDPRIDFKKGYVLVEFMMDAIKTAYTTYDIQYTEGNKGFYFTFPSVNGGDEFTFLRVIGVYSDDYDPEHQDLSENKVNCVDGLSIIKGMEMELPSASFKLSDGTVVPYTVEVKYNEEVVTVTDNKFIPAELGEYTFTYKAEGFDDQAFTVNAKNGWVLNDFNLVSDVVYIANANVYVGEDAIFNKSVKIQFNAGTNPYFSLKDKENNPINKAQADALKDVEFIEVLVYASAALSYELADGTEPIMLSTGWNVCKWDLSKFDVVSYIHETSGFITYVRTEGCIYLVFDRITAILPDEYVEPVEPENKKVVEIEMVDGISIIKGEEFTIPTALFKDEDGEVVEHTVSVKHNSEVVTITDNKFIPTELGEYVLTFKAQGFEDLVYTLNAKNGWVLNDFSKEADIVWCSGSTIGMAPKAILGSGVSLSITGGVNPYIALYDKDGGSINSADVKKLKDVKYIEVVVWASANTSLELSNGTEALALNKGWNKVTWDLSKFDITPHMHATSGFIGFIRNSVELTLYFDRFTAILAEDYTEPVEPAVELEMVDGITIVRGEEFTIPQAYYTDEQQQEVEYTVSVKHGEQVIEVVNNKFMPLALGEYTLTFKAEGFEDIVYTVNAKNGWVLNDFNKAADIVWCSGATIGMAPKAILGSAASLTVSSGVNPYIAFYDKDGNAINAGEVAKLEDVLFIEVLVWASENTSLELSNGTEALALNKGWNKVTWDLSKFDISAHMHATSGFIGFIRTAVEVTLYFDRFTVILPDEYIEPVEPKSTIDMIDGISIIKGEEFNIPGAVYTDKHAELVDYTVEVTLDGEIIEVVDNKFVPQEVGTYTITYKAEGFENQEYTLNVKNGWILNDFNATGDIVYCQGGTMGVADSAIFGKAVSLTITAGVNPYIALRDKDGNAINKPQVAKLEDVLFIEVVVWASANTSLELSNGTEALVLNKGWNVCRWDLSKFDISAHMHDTSGFIGFIRNSAELTLYFDRFTAILADDYVEPVEPVKEINFINNVSVVVESELNLPTARYLDDHAQEVDYYIEVLDPSGNEVVVSDDKFTLTELGSYTITYKADGFEDTVFTLKSVNGWVLNDFNATGDIVYCQGGTVGVASDALFGSAVSLSITGGVNPYIALRDNDGNAINAGEVAKLSDVEFIEVLVWASANTSLELSNGTEALALNKGWNVCRWDLSKFDISAHMHATSGFIGFIRNSAELTLYFDRFTAILSDEYVEPVEPVDESALVLNAFESASDITYINFGDISKTDDGVMISATSVASWAGIYVPLKENGEYISWKHLQQFEKIEIKVISSFAGEIGTANGNPMVAFSAGESTITLTLEQIIASKAASDIEYSENANGLYVCLKAMEVGETLTFVSITGLNRTIPEEDKPVVLNAFESASDITYINFGDISKTDDGVMISATSAASWSAIYVPLKNGTGYYTLEELEQFEKIEITVISSFAGEFCTAEGSASAAFSVGKSTVYFTVDQIKTAKATVDAQYAENANGLYICIKSMAVGETLTFVSIKGIKGE